MNCQSAEKAVQAKIQTFKIRVFIRPPVRPYLCPGDNSNDVFNNPEIKSIAWCTISPRLIDTWCYHYNTFILKLVKIEKKLIIPICQVMIVMCINNRYVTGYWKSLIGVTIKIFGEIWSFVIFLQHRWKCILNNKKKLKSAHDAVSSKWTLVVFWKWESWNIPSKIRR